MMQYHNWSLTELDNMLPWEREIYITLLQEYVKKENEKAAEQERQMRR